MNIALFSPNQNPYSETFIQAQKKGLTGRVDYYYGGQTNTQLEGHGRLFSKSKVVYYKLKNKLLSSNYSYKDSIIANTLIKRRTNVVLAQYGLHAHKILPAVRLAKMPLVVYFHGFDASAYSAHKATNNYKEVFAYASKIIAVSSPMIAMLKELGCPAEKLVLNPCAPSAEFNTVQPDYNAKTILALGRFVDKKAPYYTLLAFAEVLKTHEDARLVFGGDGPLLETCKNLARHFKIEERVEFPGVLSPEQFKQHLGTSRIFVQHSIRALNGDMEGTPVSLQESSLAGLAVVATNHGGIPEIIIDGQTGILCQEHDTKQMAMAITTLLSDTDMAARMGKAGKRFTAQNNSMQQHLELLQQTLEKVAAL